MKIVVLDERATQYQPFCAHLDHDIVFYNAMPNVETSFSCEVMLASPGLAAEALKAGVSPRWIQSTWAGVDTLLPLLAGSDIQLTGIKGIFGQLMSEYVFAHILSDLRDLTFFADQQSSQQWTERLPDTLAGKTMVLVGTGSIGQHIAQTAQHFGMQTIGVNRSGQPQPGFSRIETDLIGALSKADFIVASLPDTSNTTKVFDDATFRAMPSHSVFFNVGRGNSVDENALLRALTNHQIRSAVIDVFQAEPLPIGHPFWQLDNLTITPHISAPSFPKDIANIFLDNLERYESGEPLLYPIDVNRGY